MPGICTSYILRGNDKVMRINSLGIKGTLRHFMVALRRKTWYRMKRTNFEIPFLLLIPRYQNLLVSLTPFP